MLRRVHPFSDLESTVPCAHRGWQKLWRMSVLLALLVSMFTPRPAVAADLVSWGNNSWNQVTDTPTGAFKAVAAGGGHNVAIADDGSLVAWGYDEYGQVSEAPTTGMYSAIAAGAVHSVAVRSDGSLVAWGFDFWVNGTPTTGTYTAVAAGGSHSVALRGDGSLVAWGENFNGRISDTPTTGIHTAVAAGGAHSLALRDDGTIVAWGWDDYGQVSGTPTDGPYIAIAAGYAHSLAVKGDGTLVAWGWDDGGQVSGIQSLPPLDPGITYTAVAGGYFHSVALKSDGFLVTWGGDSYGVVSNVPTMGIHSAVASGNYHCLALLQETTANLRPTARAAASPAEVIVGEPVTLDGTASTDPENDPLTYYWWLSQLPVGSNATIVDSYAGVTQLTPDLPGLYEVSLVVNDGLGDSSPTSVMFYASSSVAFAQARIEEAVAYLDKLSQEQVTNAGNRMALGNFLRIAEDALGEGATSDAIHKLNKALTHTDGIPLRGDIDTRGPSRDWVVDPAAQEVLYSLLASALEGLLH